MKNFICVLLVGFIGSIACNRQKPEPPEIRQNADSIRCVQTWQKFQLPKDTILQLRYQQPVKIINGADTMALTVTSIDDLCSEEGSKTTYGCDARIKLKIELNGRCMYQTKYQLSIGRYGDGREGPNTITFKDFDCNVQYSSAPIVNDPAGGILGFYNTAILFRQLLPFAKTQVELTQLATDKQQYNTTLWLKKWCF